MTAQQSGGAAAELTRAEAARDEPAVGFDAVFAAYVDGLRDGRLKVQWCAECRRYQWPARSVCLGCHSGALEWTEVDEPTGTVFSWTVVHHAKGTPFAPVAPYAIALVELEREGVRMFAHVSEHHELSIGSRVTIDFENVTVAGYPTWHLLDDLERGR